jgi:Domain of unknown function (DUF4331)
MNIDRKSTIVYLAFSAVLFGTTCVKAASHSDAPTIKQDPQANLTDVYAFDGLNRRGEEVLNVIVHVRPFSEPGDGVMYERFAPDALYSIHITNPDTGEEAIRYDFQFSAVDASGYKNKNTILAYGLGTEVGPIQHISDGRQNYVQTYSVKRKIGRRPMDITKDLVLFVAPPNVGGNTTPHYNDTNGVAKSGATSYGTLDRYTGEASYDLVTGEYLFAGPRDDGFFADTPAIFDLLNVRILDNNGTLADGLGQDGNGVDGFKGFNVLAFAIQVPKALCEIVPGYPKVGVYASVSRRNRTYDNKGIAKSSGPWTQVNRMGNPLFNEVLVATADKDRYNATSPKDDATNFKKYAEMPELANLVNFVYGTTFATAGRTDLVGIFIPDVLRVDLSTGPVRLWGQPGFSRLSFIGGDTTTSGAPSGWPNGRRLGDDVVDIALTALASGPAFTTITVVGDNADHNDEAYNQVFPYSGTPHAGTSNLKDSP